MFVIDRIEDGIALIYDDNGSYEKVEANLIAGANEGAVVVRTDKGWVVDKAETDKITRSMKSRLHSLFNR